MSAAFVNAMDARRVGENGSAELTAKVEKVIIALVTLNVGAMSEGRKRV